MRIRVLLVLALVALLLATAAPAVTAGGINDPGGVPLYVIIKVTWDGNPMHDGSWTVYGPRWNPVVSPANVLSSCPIGPIGSCLAMNYDFKFAGKTVQFVEHQVDTVTATPQNRHVVLKDQGGGVYTGSETAEHYFPWAGGALLYFDRLDYTVKFDANKNVTWFEYLQYEHKKPEPGQ